MGKTHHFGRAMAVLAVLFFVSTAVVSAQSLDGKWFVMNCKAHVWAVNPDSGNIVIRNFGFRAYIHFSYINSSGTNGANYDYEIWCQKSPGNWEMTADSTATSLGITENIYRDWWMGLFTKDGDYVSIYTTPFVSVAPDKFKAGGEIYSGTDAKGRNLYGWISINGWTVAHPPFSN
ncbi:MAG: hypothetical protein ACYDH3_01670 [Candidatus Aminicenantales bacterium]